MDVSDVLGAVRRRWRLVVASVLLAGAAAGAFLYTREEIAEPTKYRVSVVLLVPGRDADSRTEDEPIPEGLPNQLLVGQTRLALSAEVTTDALARAEVPPDSRVSWSASLGGNNRQLTLSITSPNLELAEAIAPAWAKAYIEARRDIVLSSIRDKQNNIVQGVATLRTRLAETESQLREVFGSAIPNPGTAVDPTTGLPLEEPLIFSIDTPLALLLSERTELRSRIIGATNEYGRNASDALRPSAYAETVDRPPAQTIVPKQSSPTQPVGGILAGGLVLGLVGAVVRDRADRSIRDAKRAAAAFKAPVLATIPPRRRGDDKFPVLESPRSDQSEAFRVLAATSVATDRLPRAIMVSSASGTAHASVAANFAASLACLGVRVALVATTPEQQWFLRPFAEPPNGTVDLPQMLDLAHSGRLNGEVREKLPSAIDLPNLVVVPPGPERALDLPFDSLPPLLDALANAGVDVTVVAGPAILETADATVVAWATGSVLWAVAIGEATHAEAAEALARLELAGVKTFGVAVIAED